jgi:plastocyanin
MNNLSLSRVAVCGLVVFLGAGCGASLPGGASTNTPAAVNQPAGNQTADDNAGATGEKRAITITGSVFNPAGVAVKSGTTVTWTNQDPMPHTVTADDKSWTSEELKTGDSFSHTFTAVGTAYYHCKIHPEMKASVTTE